jgi:hypothetical protein
MYEELFYDNDDSIATTHSKISVSYHNFAGEYASRQADATKVSHESGLRMDVETLIEAAAQGNHESMNTIIKQIVPQYTPAHEYVAEGTELESSNGSVLPAAVLPGVVVNG